MTGYRTNFIGLAASTALAASLLGGCALGGGNDRPAGYAAKPLAGKVAKDVAKAERTVLSHPRDGAARAALAAAYLDAGRFASAAQTYRDAVALGEESAPTVLGLALAETALGNRDPALEVLRQFKDLIPASDLGLAYALAGDTGRGVYILGEALRGGDASPKTRQNLAFAFALNGQWTEAKLMAAQDIPADQVNARIIEWARMGRPELVMARVAHLIGVTPADDAGQPQALALANFPSVEQLAMEAQAQAAPVEVAQAAPAEAAAAAPLQQAALELPPAAPVPTVAAPVVQPITLAAAEPSRRSVASDAPAFASISLPATRAVPAAPRKPGKFVAERPAAVKPGKARGLAAAVAAGPKPVANGSHWIQLGSYTDRAVAKDGWGKFVRRTPALKGFPSVTTSATVDGTAVWRVAATGFASYADAERMCRAVKARGGACLVKRAEPSRR